MPVSGFVIPNEKFQSSFAAEDIICGNIEGKRVTGQHILASAQGSFLSNQNGLPRKGGNRICKAATKRLCDFYAIA